MAISISSVQDVMLFYKRWVSHNPQITSDIESVLKWCSYLAAGRMSNSSALSELVYSISNLVVLLNDRIILSTQRVSEQGSGDKLKMYLTVIEYSEIFIEVWARRAWGDTGKWITVILIQLIKCTLRLRLLFLHKANIIEMPPIQPLKRRNLVADDSEQPGTSAQAAEGFRLQSGRVVRKINAAPPTGIRSWKPPQLPEPEENETADLPLTGTRLVAEAMYIVKPVVHLGSMHVFGQRDWKPWCISLAMDLTSLQLLRHKRGPPVLSRRQRLELSRRSLSLLLYLLRSPFYEAHSRDRVSALLRALSSSLPLVRWVLNPLADYIPHWQDTYFYVWST